MRILFVLFIFLPLFVTSQKVVKLDSVTHLQIHDDEISFLSIYSKSGSEQYINVEDSAISGFLNIHINKSRRDFDEDDKRDSENITINKIGGVNIEQLFRNKSYQIRSRGEVIKLVKISKDYLAIIKTDSLQVATDTNFRNNKYYRSDIRTYPYFSVHLKRNKNVILINGRDIRTGYIACVQGKFKILIGEYDFSNAEIIEEKLYTNNQEFYALNVWDYSINKNINGKYQFVNSFKDVVIKEEYDTIINHSQYFICKIGNEFEIYNSLLNKLNKFPVRAYTTTSSWLQVLIKNDVHYMDALGNIYPITTKPSVQIVCDEMDSKVSYSIARKKDSLILQVDSSVFYHKGYISTSISISIDRTIQEITFLNDKYENYFESFADYSSYFKIKQNNKYGIYKLNNHKFLEVVLPTVYDTIYSNLFYIPLKFSRNGMYGYFPFDKDVKYKFVDDFKKYFTRFELPNEQKGWLDRNGNEYLDK